ncbi:hypothetical protein D3C87_1701670 [compost metagenome]
MRYRLQAGADDLAGIGAGIPGKRDDGCRERPERQACRRQAKIDELQQHQRRRTTADLDQEQRDDFGQPAFGKDPKGKQEPERNADQEAERRHLQADRQTRQQIGQPGGKFFKARQHQRATFACR